MADASPALKGRSGGSSRIPRLQRSVSFHGEAKKFTRTQQDVTEEDLTEALDDLGSLSSVCSVASCATPSSAYRKAVESACDFRRGHSSPRYALHCSTSSTASNGGTNEYLTPTQRANRTIRQLKTLLKESEANSNYKDFEIQRLTRELVGLRLEHAHCKKVVGAEKETDHTSHLATPSLADSGHFDDLSYQASQSKDFLVDKEVDLLASGGWSAEKNRIINAHTEKMEDLIRQHTTELQDVRTRFTDRLELALTQLGDSNTRYANLLTNYDHIKEELKQAETEQLRLRQQIVDLEHKVTQLQIEMEDRETLEYESREKELVQIESLTQELADKNKVISDLESKVENLSVVDSPTASNIDKEIQLATHNLQEVSLMLEHQEEIISCTKMNEQQCAANLNKKESLNHINYPSADPSIILKFLRSAIFYLLTDSENGTEHLRAIQSILEFSPEERNAVERMGRHGYL